MRKIKFYASSQSKESNKFYCLEILGQREVLNFRLPLEDGLYFYNFLLFQVNGLK